jgi:hypothetical protein
MPVDEVSVSVTAGGIDIRVVDGEIDDTRLNKAGMAKIKTGVADELPAEGDELQAIINGEVVFTGEVYSSTDNGDGSIKVKAYDEFIKTKQAARCVFTEDDFLRSTIRRIFESYGIDYRLEIDDDRTIKTNVELSRRRPDKVLWWMVRWLDLLWWIDIETGELVVGDPPMNERQLEYVLNSGVEEGGAPYQKVVVYGESPKSRKGQSTEHLVSKERVKGVAGDGEPVYEHKSKAVKSQEQADRTARALLREFWMQSKLGSVKVVGRPDIHVYDTVTMPEHLGGESHLVTGVKHRLNNDDGFTTTISVGANPEEVAEDAT